MVTELLSEDSEDAKGLLTTGLILSLGEPQSSESFLRVLERNVIVGHDEIQYIATRTITKIMEDIFASVKRERRNLLISEWTVI